jgi:hypothetical protein
MPLVHLGDSHGLVDPFSRTTSAPDIGFQGVQSFGPHGMQLPNPVGALTRRRLSSQALGSPGISALSSGGAETSWGRPTDPPWTVTSRQAFQPPRVVRHPEFVVTDRPVTEWGMGMWQPETALDEDDSLIGEHASLADVSFGSYQLAAAAYRRWMLCVAVSCARAQSLCYEIVCLCAPCVHLTCGNPSGSWAKCGCNARSWKRQLCCTSSQPITAKIVGCESYLSLGG